MNRLFLRPAHKGLIVRDPVSKQALGEEGEMKQWNKYWRRRVREGSVVVGKPVKQEIAVEEKSTVKDTRKKYGGTK